MNELFDKLMLTVWSVLRHRWLGLAVAALVMLLGWSAVAAMDYRYRASARIFVDSNRVLEPLLRGVAIQPEVTRRVALMSRALLTRPNLESLIAMADLDHGVEDEREYEVLLDRLRSNIQLSAGRGGDSIYTVAYAHENPDTAKLVVRSLISIFIESNLGDQRDDTEAAQRFLDGQIADYETRLREAEQRLSTFKRENAGSMPGQTGGYYQRLDQVQTQRREATLELREARNRRDVLARQIESERRTILASAAVADSPDATRLETLRTELDELLLRYTERHPRVGLLRESIAELERRLQSQPVPADIAAAQRQLQTSPVYQELRALYAEAEARVAELSTRVEDYADQIAELTETVDTIPVVEARLQQLDRDYETVRKQHELLLSKRESARLSDQLERKVDDVKFRIIDPPFVSSRPSSPNKPILYTLVLVLAGGAGVAIGAVLGLLRPVFHGPRSLTLATGLPVIGTVTHISTRGEILRRTAGWLLWFAVAGVLALIYLVLILIATDGFGIDALSGLEQRLGMDRLLQLPAVQRLLETGWMQTLIQRLEQLT